VTIRADELATVREGRELVASEGLRRHTVVRRVVTWTGGQPGVGTPEADDLVIAGARVRGPSFQDAAGLSSEARFDTVHTVSKITPAHTGGGYTPAQLLPTLADGQELVYVLTGDDGVPRLCRVEALSLDRPFEYTLTLREYRETP